MSREELTAADREQLAAEGIELAEAQRQLELLRDPPPPVRLVRPCTLGDGVERPSESRQEELLRLGAAARRAGRLTKFVPASGAATRMFRDLDAVRRERPEATAAELLAAGEAGDATALAAGRFVAEVPKLALGDAWAGRLGVAPAELHRRLAREPLAPLLSTLLDADGLGAAEAPKALLPFHRAAEGPRTAFAEQLREGIAYLTDETLVARFHFTVPPGGRGGFERELASTRARLGERPRLEVGFSEQSRSTQTLALAGGEPARDGEGRLVLRPAGHGALLANLEATGADIALVKNIDNVLPERRHAEIGRWKTILVGRLLELESTLGRRERPVRVVGVVRNEGEPGGGPFWVADRDGRETAQIVEGSQVDHGDRDQAAVWRSSTHFNPVDLACLLRDSAGEPCRLAGFVDPTTALVTRKVVDGRELAVLERPGLWNGAMAGWETRFVEVPAWTFAPVKTVLDLARDAHVGR